MRSRYDIMKQSKVRNKDGVPYPDVLTFPLKNFVYNYPPKEVMVTRTIIERFYMLCVKEYGIIEYDDLILWLNKKADVHELRIGEIIYVPDRRDIESFLVDNR